MQVTDLLREARHSLSVCRSCRTHIHTEVHIEVQVFELTREQERTKQAEHQEKEAQYKAYAEQERKVSHDDARSAEAAVLVFMWALSMLDLCCNARFGQQLHAAWLTIDAGD